jgi:hypothetical protein
MWTIGLCGQYVYVDYIGLCVPYVNVDYRPMWTRSMWTIGLCGIDKLLVIVCDFY